MSTLIPMDTAFPASPAIAGNAPASAMEVRAAAAGFAVLAASAWPETADDVAAPALAGFVSSSFSPLAAEVARRCLERRAAAYPVADPTTATATAVIVVSALGDLAAARNVARAVDAGTRIAPLMFFQCVPNAVAGYVAARWRLTGPVVCLCGDRAALDAAGLLLEDGDADEVLLIRVEQAAGAQDRDSACAVLLAAGALPATDAQRRERGRI